MSFSKRGSSREPYLLRLKTSSYVKFDKIKEIFVVRRARTFVTWCSRNSSNKRKLRNCLLSWDACVTLLRICVANDSKRIVRCQMFSYIYMKVLKQSIEYVYCLWLF